MEIRLAKPKDLPVVVDILNKATQKLTLLGVPQWKYPWDAEFIAREIEQGVQYFATKKGRPVAVFAVKPVCMSEWTKTTQTVFYLYRLAVYPNKQGSGIGKAVCKKLIACAKKQNTHIYLDCYAGSAVLRKFYESAGFSYLGDFPEENYFISVFFA